MCPLARKQGAHLNLQHLDNAGHVREAEEVQAHQALHGCQGNGQQLARRLGVVAGQEKGREVAAGRGSGARVQRTVRQVLHCRQASLAFCRQQRQVLNEALHGGPPKKQNFCVRLIV